MKENTVEIDPIQFCIDKINEIDKKADHNKDEALRAFKLVMVSTLSAPMFVAFGDGIIWGKIIPSCLSLMAAMATAWLQLRKPQQLWAIYRTAHRELEYELNMYKFNSGDYENLSEPHKLLVSRSCDIGLDVHNKWLGLVPSPESLNAVKPQTEGTGN